MKSDARKSNARKTASAPAADMAINLNIEVADAEYATQLLLAAEALAPPSAATVASAKVSDSKVSDSGVTIQANATVMSKPMTQAKSMAKSDEIATGKVILPAQCLMRDAIELKTQLLPRIDVKDTIQIDVSKVERIDAAAIQVLLAFVCQRTAQQRKVEWLGMNAVMAEAATTLGLVSLLQLPDLRAAA